MADPDGGCGVFNPLFSSGSGTFLIEMVLVLSGSDESEYVISNVLSNVLVFNYLSFKVNGSYCVPEHTRQCMSRSRVCAVFVCSRIQIREFYDTGFV